jgi:gamma-glutamylcyclotransferase (GGCT)/AIG2-like uncharacterized protein YtfP
MTGPELLFVYGSLRRGSGSLMSERLASEATHVGDATVAGALYDTGTFPALRPDVDPTARVHGEVWALRPETTETLLAMLDQYEGYAPDARFGSLFRRVRVPVRFEDGSEREVWVYEYNHGTDQTSRVLSGDWLNQ